MTTTSTRKKRVQKDAPSYVNGNEVAPDLALDEPEAIKYFGETVLSGKDWHRALLEAIGMWTRPEEWHEGRYYKYMVSGEAFDWLLLAERLCSAVDGIVPAGEKERLLFHGLLPGGMEQREFNESIGLSKYRAYLNYWYGVVVEEALQVAVEAEVRKRHRAKGYADTEDLIEKAFVRIYNDTRTNLLKLYIKENGGSLRAPLTLTDLKEFTYWLFKKRLKYWDPARVASDTQKGLAQLKRLKASRTSSSSF